MLSSPLVHRAIPEAPKLSTGTLSEVVREDETMGSSSSEEDEEEGFSTPALNLSTRPTTSASLPPQSQRLQMDSQHPPHVSAAREVSDPAELIIQRLADGYTFVSSFPGTSQYSSGGPSACGLASMNAASHVIAVHASGIRNTQLLGVMHEKRFHEVRFVSFATHLGA